MLTSFWQKMTFRQRVLLAVALLLGVGALANALSGSLENWPLPANIRQEERQVKQLCKELARLQQDELARRRDIEQLRQQAKVLWVKSSKLPSMEVQTELESVARRAKVVIQNIGAPRNNKLSDNISSVELSLRLGGSMRDMSRFLAELEKNDPPFFWASCNLRPDNLREPKALTLDGRVQLLILSPDASKFLFGTSGATP